MDGMHHDKRFLRYRNYLLRNWLKIGPGLFIAIGYIDPGNWSTDLAGGSYAGYALLSIVVLSGLVAMLLQVMSARLGIATGKDLAQLSSENWPHLRWIYWISAEIAMVATDIAEIIGSAIALKLLFSIPIILGIVLTVLDVFLLLSFNGNQSNYLERTVAFLLIVISCGFIFEIAMAQPVIHEVIQGLVPSTQIVQDSKLLYLAIGIIGATIMPHNLYLHSNLVLNKWEGQNINEKARSATVDTIIFLTCAVLFNSALVILSGSVFHYSHLNVCELDEAFHLLPTILGSSFAAIVFAIMLLASGQSATITGTLAGQVVLNGFLRAKIKPWVRRLLTRSVALMLALVTSLYFGEQYMANLLVSSQVLLSLQLPLAMIPLLLLTSNKKKMGILVNNIWMRQLGYWSLFVILVANGFLFASFF